MNLSGFLFIYHFIFCNRTLLCLLFIRISKKIRPVDKYGFEIGEREISLMSSQTRVVFAFHALGGWKTNTNITRSHKYRQKIHFKINKDNTKYTLFFPFLHTVYMVFINVCFGQIGFYIFYWTRTKRRTRIMQKIHVYDKTYLKKLIF